MHVITSTSVIQSCVEVSWGSLMYQRLLMSIEWKLKAGINLSSLAIDRSVGILSGRQEGGADREAVYL